MSDCLPSSSHKLRQGTVPVTNAGHALIGLHRYSGSFLLVWQHFLWKQNLQDILEFCWLPGNVNKLQTCLCLTHSVFEEDPWGHLVWWVSKKVHCGFLSQNFYFTFCSNRAFSSLYFPSFCLNRVWVHFQNLLTFFIVWKLPTVWINYSARWKIVLFGEKSVNWKKLQGLAEKGKLK